MPGELTAKGKVVGLKQTRRALVQGAAAHVYPDYNFHSVYEPSCFCYTVLLYTVSRALSRDKPFCIFVKNRVFLFPFAHFYDMI